LSIVATPKEFRAAHAASRECSIRRPDSRRAAIDDRIDAVWLTAHGEPLVVVRFGTSDQG
jgi:hypothetical protein